MTNVKTNSIKAWLLAARPKTLTGAAIPVMLGCALAFIYGHFQLTPALLCFLFAFLMQIDANFINDLFDFLKGSDREDRLGPERACAQGWISAKAMKAGIACTTLLAGITGLCLLYYGGLEMIPIGIACMILPSSIPPDRIRWLITDGATCWYLFSSASYLWDVPTMSWHTTGTCLSPWLHWPAASSSTPC